MKKTLKILFLVLSATTFLCANEAVSEQFDTVMTQMRQQVEQKVAAAGSGLSPLVAFANGVEKSCNLFKEINSKFVAGAFEDEHAVVHTTFETFCKMVTNLKVKPWGVRQLEGGIKALDEATAKALRRKIKNKENYQTAKLIKDFSRTMFSSVCPMLRIYVGTTFERNIIDRIFRMTGFYFRNWWWTIPLTALVTKLSYDVLTFKMPSLFNKVTPEDWNMNTTTRPDQESLEDIKSSWSLWKKMTYLVGSLGVFSLLNKKINKSRSGEGWISMNGGGEVCEPVYDKVSGKEWDIDQVYTDYTEKDKKEAERHMGVVEKKYQAGMKKFFLQSRSKTVFKSTSRKVKVPTFTACHVPTFQQDGAECMCTSFYFACCWLKFIDGEHTSKDNKRFIDKKTYTKMKNEYIIPRLRSNDPLGPDDLTYMIGPPQNGCEWGELGHLKKLIAGHANYVKNHDPDAKNDLTNELDERLMIVDKTDIDVKLTNNFLLPANQIIQPTRGTEQPFGEMIANLRYAKKPNKYIIVLRRGIGKFGGHYKTYVVTRRGKTPAIWVTDGLGKKEKTNDWINAWLVHLLFAQTFEDYNGTCPVQTVAQRFGWLNS
jgi:hypothetical protein